MPRGRRWAIREDYRRSAARSIPHVLVDPA
jgi:hypothetical protein